MDLHFLSIQGSYQDLELAIFYNNKCLNKIKKNNKKGSSCLLTAIDELLNNLSLKLSSIKFIAIDQGPGAFTSLRVTITTANALSFATNIPLIGISGLEALAYSALDRVNDNDLIISILNAYHEDIYYAVFKKQNNQLLLVEEPSYKNIETFINELTPNAILIGNALEKIPGHLFIINEPKIATPENIAMLALIKWNKQEGLSNKLLPLYIKTQAFKIKQ